jgi:hypothetical protein
VAPPYLSMNSSGAGLRASSGITCHAVHMINAMIALRDLDCLTPSFFVTELFAHGSLDMRKSAVQALQDLNRHHASETLQEILKCSSR